jgi:ribose 5-phosphate isomerase B
MERIAIGSDHGGVELKDNIAAFLRERGIEVVDCGTNGADSVDYPDFAEKVALAVVNAEVSCGIIICGTGIGISIAANKIPGIRAALVTDPFMARMAREHNDANIIALGGRVLETETARQCVAAWLDAAFEGGRHQRRLDKITELEKKYAR